MLTLIIIEQRNAIFLTTSIFIGYLLLLFLSDDRTQVLFEIFKSNSSAYGVLFISLWYCLLHSDKSYHFYWWIHLPNLMWLPCAQSKNPSPKY